MSSFFTMTSHLPSYVLIEAVFRMLISTQSVVFLKWPTFLFHSDTYFRCMMAAIWMCR